MEFTALAGLFAGALLAATILPFYSEVLFIALLTQGYDPFTVWLVASAGNTAGSAINWCLGRYLLHFQNRRWFPFKPAQIERAQHWYQRFGVWSLLFAWLPVGGDALTLIAGIMRVRFDLFLLLTAIGKSGRYAALLLTVAGFFNNVSAPGS